MTGLTELPKGAVRMKEETDFSEFMHARWGALFRTAYLLAGSRHEAEDLLQDALGKTCVRWRFVRDKAAAETADSTEAPPIDDVGFERLVRRHRHRRRASLAGATAAVAAVALAVPLVVSQIGSDDRTAQAPPVASPDSNRPPVYFYTGDGDRMLDPTGRIHQLTDDGHNRQVVVGLTQDGVVVSMDDGLVRFQAVEEAGQWRLERSALSAERGGTGAVSADGRYFAVTNQQGDIVVYDLTTNRESEREQVGADWNDVAVLEYSDRVLWSADGSLWLGLGAERIEIPDVDLPHPMSAEVGGQIVAVEDWPATLLYDVSGGTARQIDTVDGYGALSPDGRYYLSPIWEAGPVKPLVLWERGSDMSLPVRGVDERAGVVGGVSWLDDDTAVVVTDTAERSTMWTCEASTRQCEELLGSDSTQYHLLD